MKNDILAVGGLILNNTENKILLKTRTKEPDKGKLEIIAGYINYNERLRDALNY